MDSIAWILALPICAGGVGLFLPSARVVTASLVAALALHLLILSPALALGTQPPLTDPSAWLALSAPPPASWVPLLLCLLAAAAGARERFEAGASAWAGLVAGACTLALCVSSPLVSVAAMVAAGLFSLAAQQRGSLDGQACELGVGSHLLVAGAGTLALALAALGFDGLTGSRGAWPALAGVLLVVPAYALTRQGAGQRAPGLLLAGALAVTILSWLAAQGANLPAALGWAGICLALVSAADALLSPRVDRALRGWWLSALGLGWASLCWGGGGQILAAASLVLAALSLSSESAAQVSGGWEADRWRGLRRLSPGASGAALLALVATIVPGGLWQRSLDLDDSNRGWVLALAGVPLVAGAFRVLARAVRGAAIRPERGPRLHLAYLPALFAAGLGLPFLPAGDPLLSSAGLDVGALGVAAGVAGLGALAVAALASRLPSGRGSASRDRLERLLEPYSPQRRLVQPILGQARKCAAREARWFEGTRLALALSQGARFLFRSPRALESWLATRPFAPSSPSPWRGVLLEAAAFFTALALALLLLYWS